MNKVVEEFVRIQCDVQSTGRRLQRAKQLSGELRTELALLNTLSAKLCHWRGDLERSAKCKECGAVRHGDDFTDIVAAVQKEINALCEAAYLLRPLADGEIGDGFRAVLNRLDRMIKR